MIEQVEIKRRKIRWWFNIVSSIVILFFGLFMLGLLLGYGLIRLAFHLWRRQHLFDDMDDDSGEDA